MNRQLFIHVIVGGIMGSIASKLWVLECQGMAGLLIVAWLVGTVNSMIVKG